MGQVLTAPEILPEIPCAVLSPVRHISGGTKCRTLAGLFRLCYIAKDPFEKNNVASENPDKVAVLQKRATELAATMAKALYLETELKPILDRLAMPPAPPNGRDR